MRPERPLPALPSVVSRYGCVSEQQSTTSESDFCGYLAKHFVGARRFQFGVPEEAAALVEQSDFALYKNDLGLEMVCLLDREKDPTKTFSMSREDLFQIGRACLKYTGNVNGAKMPVSITLYEVGAGPASDADRARLKALTKNYVFAKVALATFHIDARSGSVWSPLPLNGFLGRRWLERLLRAPRKKDDEMLVPDPALPKQERVPFATIAILGLLVAVFVVEQLAQSGDKRLGLFSVDAATLFALGATSSDAVLEHGEWYRLFSAALLHADAIHLLLNGVALGLAAYLLESLVGPAWLLALFLLGAAGGSFMGLIVNSADVMSVGASGAVMGLLAAALILAMRFPPGAARLQIQGRLLQFLIPSLIPLAMNHGGHIDVAAHFGGAIAGLLSGYALFTVWPKNEENPRFPMVARGLAVMTVFVFGLSIALVKRHYATYLVDSTFRAADFLVDDSRIPEDPDRARREVESWGQGHPRDPRVHFFRALHLLDQNDEAGAESELRAALGEREILAQAFSDNRLETSMRTVLCQLLLSQGKHEEARRVAAPVCTAEDGSLPTKLKQLGLCN